MLTADCSLLTTYYLLLTTPCSLLTAHCSLLPFTAYCLLSQVAIPLSILLTVRIYRLSLRAYRVSVSHRRSGCKTTLRPSDFQVVPAFSSKVHRCVGVDGLNVCSACSPPCSPPYSPPHQAPSPRCYLQPSPLRPSSSPPPSASPRGSPTIHPASQFRPSPHDAPYQQPPQPTCHGCSYSDRTCELSDHLKMVRSMSKATLGKCSAHRSARDLARCPVKERAGRRSVRLSDTPLTPHRYLSDRTCELSDQLKMVRSMSKATLGECSAHRSARDLARCPLKERAGRRSVRLSATPLTPFAASGDQISVHCNAAHSLNLNLQRSLLRRLNPEEDGPSAVHSSVARIPSLARRSVALRASPSTRRELKLDRKEDKLGILETVLMAVTLCGSWRESFGLLFSVGAGIEGSETRFFANMGALAY